MDRAEGTSGASSAAGMSGKAKPSAVEKLSLRIATGREGKSSPSPKLYARRLGGPKGSSPDDKKLGGKDDIEEKL